MQGYCIILLYNVQGVSPLNVRKIILSIPSVIILIIAVLCSNIRVRADNICACMLPDGKGGFFLAERTGDNLTVYKLRSGTGSKKLLREKFAAEQWTYNDSGLYIAGLEYGRVFIIKVTDRERSSFPIENISSGVKFISSGSGQDIYITEEGSPDVINRYRNVSIPDGKINLDRDILALFTDNKSGKVFALTDGGVCDASDGRFISCGTPEVPFCQSGGYYSDLSGSLFTFSPESGFAKAGEYDCEYLNCINGFLYGLYDGKIIKADTDGRVVSYYAPEKEVSEFSVSGNVMAVRYGDGAEIISNSSFKKAEGAFSGLNIRRDVNNNNTSDIPSDTGASSGQEVSDDEMQPFISFGSFETEGDLICGVPSGTTAAQFKKQISFSGYELKFYSKNGSEKASGKLGTGCMMTVSSPSENKKYYMIVHGDLTGEGNINTLDIREAVKYLLGEKDPDRFALKAADFSGDGEFNIVDAVMLHREYCREKNR